MPKVKLKVLLSATDQIIAKLYKDSFVAKLDENSSNEKQQVALLTKFKGHIGELNSGEDLSEKRVNELEGKLNEVLDKFSELVRNKDLKKQINDAFKKRIKSKDEKKYTLKSSTADRLETFLSTRKIDGSFDETINGILDLFNEPNLSNDTTSSNILIDLQNNVEQKLVQNQSDAVVYNTQQHNTDNDNKKKSYHELHKSLKGSKKKNSRKKKK